MWQIVVLIAIFLGVPVLKPAWAVEGIILPTVEFQATAIHQSGPIETKETIHYADGKLRIDPGGGFSSTILDLNTQTECLLMANHTYLLLPMDNELFRRYLAQSAEASDVHKLGTERIEGFETTKYAFGNDGALNAAGMYWLTKTGVMIRRVYNDGVFGEDHHHVEFLTHIVFKQQPAALFLIPPGYRKAH